MAKDEAVWWILGGVVVLGLARSAQVARINAAAGTPAAQAGGFFGGILSSLGIGGAAAYSNPAADAGALATVFGAGNPYGGGFPAGLAPINYAPVNYGSPGYVPATATPGGGFNNLAGPTFGANQTGAQQYMI